MSLGMIITSGILGYLFMSLLTFYSIVRFDMFEDEFGIALCAMFWPFAGPVIAVGAAFVRVGRFAKARRDSVQYRRAK